MADDGIALARSDCVKWAAMFTYEWNCAFLWPRAWRSNTKLAVLFSAELRPGRSDPGS
jgi:hypothetical protein